MEETNDIQQILTMIDLLRSKDIRDVKDAIRVLSGKIDRLNPQAEQSDAIDKLTEALAKSKLAASPLKESGTGNRGKYSTLEDYEEAYEEALAQNGLAIAFTPQMIAPDTWVLVTKLLHSSGQWLRSVLPIEASESTQRTEEQGYGSSITYMKRYSYAAMMGR